MVDVEVPRNPDSKPVIDASAPLNVRLRELERRG